MLMTLLRLGCNFNRNTNLACNGKGTFLKSYYFYYFGVKIQLGLFPVVLREHSTGRFNLMCTPQTSPYFILAPSHSLDTQTKEAEGLGG